MKNRIPTFLAGVFTTLLLGTLTISALAISGRMTIEVDPINIQVNGVTFQPKDAGGNDVPVFAYNGTTYAPLRALAEAYGLEVGYDAEKNMATVVDPAIKKPNNDVVAATPIDYSKWSAEEEAAYQEFKAMWDVSTEDSDYGSFVNLYCYDTEKEVDKFLQANTAETVEKFCFRFDNELYSEHHRPNIMYHFMGRGAWGWQDIFSDEGWECRYRENILDEYPERHNVELVKVGDNYYAQTKDGPTNSGISYVTRGNLVFADENVQVINSKMLTSWQLSLPIKYALTEKYIAEKSKNPYFEYIADKEMKQGYENIDHTAGMEETVWYSPSESYTPMWWEVNGYKLYNLDPKCKEMTEDGYRLQNGIRYYNGMPCLNDIFDAFGIDKTISFGEYEGFEYMEIK